MQVHIEEVRKLRKASACIRHEGVVQVRVPHHWPKATKLTVIEELLGRIQRKDQQEKQLLAKQGAHQNRITIHTQGELEALVRQINAETFQASLGKVQIGSSRYNHLAQVNLHTHTLTVSRFCLKQAPYEALRYLIIHELAHYQESGHGPAFWALVAKYVPDYRLQSRLMKAFHHQAVILENQISPAELQSLAEVPQQTSRYASKPANNKPIRRQKASLLSNESQPIPDSSGNKESVSTILEPASTQNKTGRLPGFVRQLLLWSQS